MSSPTTSKSSSNDSTRRKKDSIPSPGTWTHGELVFLYPPYALGPYSSGDFTLTIERADAPELFTETYPLNQPPHEAI
ncbi:DUF3298 domain-containing protein [Selenomonas sputigena]|uniref:RsiV family protein n=1 Tax=Selenomonas sputigena TaxID=69823 RepID=UPI0036F2F81E